MAEEANPYKTLLSRPRGVALICDDDIHITGLIHALLEESNFQVVVAHRGQEALDLLGLAPTAYGEPLIPELIMLDYEIGDMTGYEVLQKIRSGDHTRKIPVIMLTATAKPVKDIVSPDLDAYLRKPFNAKALLEAIEKVVGTQHS